MSKVYLVPSVLDESATQTIPAYIIDNVKDCQVIFAENERTTRRFLKSIHKQIVIDDFEWFTIHKAEEEVRQAFTQLLKEGRNRKMKVINKWFRCVAREVIVTRHKGLRGEQTRLSTGQE